MVGIKNLELVIGVVFKNPALLETALTHRSFLNENRRLKLIHNERMEFLGDAVLELAVTEYLYNHYPDSEGVLTNWRSALVKTDSLSATAVKLGLDKFIRLSRGEAKGGERAKRQIMANTMEAIIGAIYLDQGYKMAESFVRLHIINQLADILKTGAWLDAKTQLQEMAQEKEGYTPIYKVLSETGPDHDKIFNVGAYIGSNLRGKGSGSSKQIAQQAAAAAALKKYGK